MKKLIIFGLVCFSLTVGYAQGLFRYVNNERHYFEVCPNRVVIRVGEEMTESAIESSFQRNISLQKFDISATGNREFKFVRFHSTNRNAVTQLVNQRISNDTILYVGHVIIDETGRETAALTNQIILRLMAEGDFPILQKTLAPAGADVHVRANQ